MKIKTQEEQLRERADDAYRLSQMYNAIQKQEEPRWWWSKDRRSNYHYEKEIRLKTSKLLWEYSQMLRKGTLKS